MTKPTINIFRDNDSLLNRKNDQIRLSRGLIVRKISERMNLASFLRYTFMQIPGSLTPAQLSIVNYLPHIVSGSKRLIGSRPFVTCWTSQSTIYISIPSRVFPLDVLDIRCLNLLALHVNHIPLWLVDTLIYKFPYKKMTHEDCF